MFKLTVIAGPNRGTSYALNEGETTIGRQSGNVIVLPSARVSKRHCTLVVNGGEIELRDAGSANGTFVNGVLARAKALAPGDRVSVGDYVLEVRKPKARASHHAPAILDMGNVIQFPGSQPAPMSSGSSMPNLGSSGVPGGVPGVMGAANQMPTDLKGKLLWHFERFVMPFFYGLNVKYEWKLICVWLFAFLLLLNLSVSVYPLLEANRLTVLKEAGRRAKLMARQIAEMNGPYLASSAETKTTVGSMDQEGGVRLALLIDLENRILAPPARMNNYLASGDEATFAVKMAKVYRQGGEMGFAKLVNESTLVAIEPVKILDARLGRNVVVAMALVSVDVSLVTPDFGEMGIIYSKVFIITALIAGFVLLVLYRLTLKPFEMLNADLDRVLKGDLTQVNRDFKSEETKQLWDVINAAIQRIPHQSSGNEGEGPRVPLAEEVASAMRPIGDLSPNGVLICDADRKVLYMNPAFEDASGMRADASVGNDIASIARDQAFGALCTDLFSQVQGREGTASEDFDFGGITFKVHAASIGGANTRGFVLATVRQEA